MGSTHFNEKEAIAHVVEKQALGIVEAQEVHGNEIPGHLSAATDSAKETALYLCFVAIILNHHQMAYSESIYFLFLFFIATLVWKTCRSAWLGWARLERLHRVIAQEKWEIEHHRTQEREELKALYAAKGFQGQLLDDVVDVLMADGDRLLKVMVEEELGLSLETQQHPLKQALGAFIGALVAGTAMTAGIYIQFPQGALIACLVVVALSSFFAARYEKNNGIQAVIWNLGLALLSLSSAYFLALLLIPAKG